MAPHSSTFAWKIPWAEEPGRLQSMGSPRVGHDWATSLSLFTFMHWRRKWQPIPGFLPGESQGRGESGGLLSLGSRRVGHDWSDLAAAAAAANVLRATKINAFLTSQISSFLKWSLWQVPGSTCPPFFFCWQCRQASEQKLSKTNKKLFVSCGLVVVW